MSASPLARLLAGKAGVETDRAGRLPVNPDCTLPGHPEVFAIGDMVSLNKLPGVAQPAIQEGKYVARVIKDRLAGIQTPPFKYTTSARALYRLQSYVVIRPSAAWRLTPCKIWLLP